MAGGAATIAKQNPKAGSAVARIGAQSTSGSDQSRRKSQFRASTQIARQVQSKQQSEDNRMRRDRNAPAMRNVRPNMMPMIPAWQQRDHDTSPRPSPSKEEGVAQPFEETAANDNVEYASAPEEESNVATAQSTEDTQQTVDASAEDEQVESTTRQSNINKLMQQARIQGLFAEAAGMQAQEQPEESETDRAAKQLAKKAIPRGAAFLGTGIAGALDLGTGGVAVIVDIFVYLFTLGYLNFEMLTGQLSWDPLPMPIDKDADFLKLLIIMADVFVIVIILVLFTIQAIVILVMFAPLLLAGWVGTEGALALINFLTK